MKIKQNSKPKSYRDLIEKGLDIISKAESIDHYTLSPIGTTYVDLIVNYYRWKKEIQEFFESNPGNEIAASYFKEPDNIPTIDYLDKYNQLSNQDFDPLFAYKVVNEVKIKLKHIRDIASNDEKDFSNKESWITKNNNGDYFFKGSLVDIRSKDAEYVIIFDVVFSLKPNGGQVSYKEIIEGCKKRKLKSDKKSILRALSGANANFFRYVKGIEQSPSHGIELFRADQKGRYLEFNNSKK